ncbi:MAG TPA: type VI secretion system tube protein Hcp [Candidatus Angelobacter sp.]|nr:type VI secretion system tube protein Hcp [Candidatus Angelobacter sp.]
MAANGGMVDYFLKLDGIEGESLDSKHKNTIELMSWSFGANQSGSAHSGGGAGVGKVHLQDFHVVKSVDKASPKLLLACANGEHIKQATLIARKAGKEQQEYLKIVLSDVLVSSYNNSGNGTILPTEEVSLHYGKIEVEYKEQKTDGSLGGVIKAGWNAKENKAV